MEAIPAIARTERIAGPSEATRLFNRTSEKKAAESHICIDHSEDDVPVSSFTAGSTSIFSCMRNRSQVVMPAYHDDRVEDKSEPLLLDPYFVPDVVAERVKTPVELRFFPQRGARAARIVDC